MNDKSEAICTGVGEPILSQKFIVIHDLVNSETGLTYKEENLKKPHNIPIGTLVEVRWDEWFGGGACWKVHARLWIVAHRRDCDGTPIYSVSRWSNPISYAMKGAHHGFGEESLLPIKVTDELVYGHGALEWEDEL